ncbi:MAG: hypothetical protein FWC27_03710 [Firmicutes bacterium]|nr:hypothetical protein [Bacillota bacterium]
MKKVFAVILALALALSMAMMASAEEKSAADDLAAVLQDLSATVGADDLKAAFEEAWAEVSKKLDIKDEDAKDAGNLPAETGNEVADSLIEKLGLKDTAMADKIQGAMSNDFVSFLCGMYTGEFIATGDSSAAVIAIASFAALSAVAAAAFVVMKKKDD